MWDSARCLANASVPWCRGRWPRQLAAVALSAGPAALPCGQVSSHWKLNANQASHLFSRSYASSFKTKRKASRKPPHPQPSDYEESPTTVDNHTSGVVGTNDKNRLMDFLLHLRAQRQIEATEADSMDLSTLHVDGERNPGLRDGKRIPWAQSDGSSQSWEGYPSGSDSINIVLGQCGLQYSSRSLNLSKLYLRDICQCSRCVCPSTGLKNFATCDIPEIPRVRKPEINNVTITADESLEITWEDDFLTGDDHKSVYSWEFLNSL